MDDDKIFKKNATQWALCFAKLKAMLNYAYGWDGDNADPIDPLLINRVTIYLHGLHFTFIDCPPEMVYADQDGCIYVEWNSEDIYFEAEGDEVSWFANLSTVTKTYTLPQIERSTETILADDKFLQALVFSSSKTDQEIREKSHHSSFADLARNKKEKPVNTVFSNKDLVAY